MKNLTYSNDDLEKERKATQEYFLERSYLKKYPQDYIESLLKLMKRFYEVVQFNENKTLLSSGKFNTCFEYVKQKHSGQFRNFCNFEYILHPVEMACRLSSLAQVQDEQIMAALLHDCVEDCGVTLEEINYLFGAKTSDYVHYLTDYAKDGNREKRSQENFNHFKNSPVEVKNLKIVDILSNTRSLVTCNPGFAPVYTQSLEKMTNYFKEISCQIDAHLFDILEKTFNLSKETLNLQSDFNILKYDRKKTKKFI